MLHRRTTGQIVDDGGGVQPAVSERIGEFVEHHQAQPLVAQHVSRHGPGASRGRRVAGEVLGLPAESFAEHVPGDAGLAAKEAFLAGIPATLDELGDTDLQAVAEGARHHAEGGGGFALALSGEHQQQALVANGEADAGIDHGLLALHPCPVAPFAIAAVAGHRAALTSFASTAPRTSRISPWIAAAAATWIAIACSDCGK